MPPLAAAMAPTAISEKNVTRILVMLRTSSENARGF
jgi:hypothetical protein